MCSPNTSQIQTVVSNQERSETQLQTISVPVATKMLGFTRFLFDVTTMEQVDFSIVFQGFGGIRSTQPTELFYLLGHKFHNTPPYSKFSVGFMFVCLFSLSIHEKTHEETPHKS